MFYRNSCDQNRHAVEQKVTSRPLCWVPICQTVKSYNCLLTDKLLNAVKMYDFPACWLVINGCNANFFFFYVKISISFNHHSHLHKSLSSQAVQFAASCDTVA